MHFGFLGVLELAILIGFGGGAGLPLGVPPAPEEPLLAAVAPEECLFYLTWAGMAEPDPNSTNQTEQLLAEPQVRRMIAEIEQRIKSAVRQTVRNEEPEEFRVDVTWAGTAEPDPNMKKQVEQVLADPQVRGMIAEIEQSVKSQAPQTVRNDEPEALPLPEDALQWGKTLLTSPTAVFVSEARLGPAGPDVRAGALVCVDDEGPKLKAALDKYQQMFLPGMVESVQIGGDAWNRVKLDPDVPEITWGVKGRFFIVGVGEGTVDGILERARTPVPKWLADVRQQLTLDRNSTLTYVHVKSLINRFLPMAGLAGGMQAQGILDATGLADVTFLASATGLDETGFVKRTLLGLSGEPRGLLSFAAAEPLGPDDLAPIPRDATVALAARLDPDAIFETVLDTLDRVDPRARGEFLQELGEMEQALGFSVRDLLRAVGDSWCVYNSPGEGGLVITGLTAVVEVKDRQTLADAHAKFLARARSELDGGDPRRGPRIEQFDFSGQKVYFFNARDSEFPLAPAWCLTEDELIVATFPQNVKACLSRGKDFKSLATMPEVAALFEASGGPVMLSYVDTPELFELAYPLAPMIAQVAMSELQREGIDVNVSILPSANVISKHLRPGVTILRRTEAGIELLSRQSLPGGSVGTAAPVAAGVLLSAVPRARGSARRAAGANNLKQIAVAMHNHHDASKSFPPAYSTGDDGKPLLSWRVKILPFIEEQALYHQFRLDEPWDSEHNQKLILKMPQIYRAPGSTAPPGKTGYLTVRGADTVFPGKDGIAIHEIHDGSSNTIMVVEAGDAQAVTWTRPDDFEYDPDNPVAGLLGMRRGGFNAAFCDGSVRFIPEGIDANELRALFTRARGEMVQPGQF